MIDKVRTVSNPLTIIAIFAALAEIAGTVVLGLVDKSIQEVFVWFVMLFPTAIVLLFFGTLNFNPRVLYAPSDFKDEQNFLQSTLGAGTSRLKEDLNRVSKELKEAKAVIETKADKPGADWQGTKEKLRELLDGASRRVENTKESVDDLKQSSSAAYWYLVSNNLSPNHQQGKILSLLQRFKKPMTRKEIGSYVEGTERSIAASLGNLKDRGFVKETEDGESFYIPD